MKIDKKIIFILFAVIFLLMGLAGSLAATEVSIPALEVEPGNTINVPIMIDRTDNLAGLKLVLSYDPKILQYRTSAKTSHTASLMHIVNDKTPGRLIIVMAGATGVKGENFPLFTMTFAASGGLKGNHTTRIKIAEIQLMSDKLKEIDSTVHTEPIVVRFREPQKSDSPEKKGEEG